MDALLKKLIFIPRKRKRHKVSACRHKTLSPSPGIPDTACENPAFVNNDREKDLSEKEDLINMLMHDLRTPLARTRGLAELLGATQLNEEQKQLIQMILKASGDGLNLANEMLHLNSATHQHTGSAAIDLHLFIHDLIRNYFDGPAREKNIHINVAVEDHLQINIHALTLQRILDNLISNAIKFSEAGTTVHIRVLNTENYFYISVQDEGPGISAEDQKMLFKKFKKLTSQPTAGEASTGLGLFIVKNLLEKVGGTMTVKSERGKGAEFIIRLSKEMNESRPTELQA